MQETPVTSTKKLGRLMIRQRVRRTVSAYNLKRERRERTGKLERTDDLMTPDPPTLHLCKSTTITGSFVLEKLVMCV